MDHGRRNRVAFCLLQPTLLTREDFVLIIVS